MLGIILIVGIVVYFVYKCTQQDNTYKSTPPTPPTEDVYMLGCCGNVECGYWSLEVTHGSDGHMNMNAGKCYCSYKKQWVKEFSECPLAKEHPELIVRGSVFDNV